MNRDNEAAKEPLVDPYKVLPNSKNQRLKLTTATPFTPEFVQSSVTQASDPAGIYTNRIKGRQVLLENPVRESRAKKERDEKKSRRLANKKRRDNGVVGKREAKEKGLWRLEEGIEKFALFIPLHHLWMGYMSELLGLVPAPTEPTSAPTTQSMPNAAGMHAKLVKADLHGSIVSVRQSKNPCLVGLSGIVIHETENAFKVVTKQDKLKLIPKQNSVFAFAVPLYSKSPPSISAQSSTSASTPDFSSQDLKTVLDNAHIEFELYGNQFRFRSAERAGRKFKHKETIEL